MLESLFNKVIGLQTCNFIKRSLQHKCFPVNMVKSLRTAFFIKHLRWLLLIFVKFTGELFFRTPATACLFSDIARVSLLSLIVLIVRHRTKMKFSIKDFFSTFTEEILNGKLHFLCSESYSHEHI